MDILQEMTRGDTEAVAPELHDKLLEPFIIATRLTLSEMAGAEVRVQAVYQKALPRALGDISAVLGLMGAMPGSLVLSFSRQTAEALAGRILAGLVPQVDDDLVRDCMGEIANVIAGQTKSQLVGTPYHFVFSTPTVVAGCQHEARTRNGLRCLVVAFNSDLGDFAAQLCLDLGETPAAAPQAEGNSHGIRPVA